MIARAAAQGQPYVAFSGGKDSLCVLALAHETLQDVTAIWTDDELEYPEQPAYIPAVCAALGVTLRIKTGTQTHNGWFRSWTDAPYWREPLPGTVVTRESVRVLAPQWGYPVTILGLRREENARRDRYLTAKGRLHQLRDGTWRCNPLAGWTVDEVWALIAGWDLPYSPVYDVLTTIRVPREVQRVGPLPLSPGSHLRHGWPVLWDALLRRYGLRWDG